MTDTAEDLPALRALEALFFVSDEPLTTAVLAAALEVDRRTVDDLCAALQTRLEERGSGLVLRDIAGGWRLYSHPDTAQIVEQFVLSSRQARLTKAALETLAIVAYKQPVSRPEIDAARGVNSEGVLDNLMERRLVRIAGRKEAPGRPFLFETTREFLIAFGLRDVGDLPKVEGELVLPDLTAAEADVAATPNAHADADTPAEQDPGAGGTDVPAGR